MFLHDGSEESTSAQESKGEQRAKNLFEMVASQNGLLEDHHPQMLLQCLLWGTCVVMFLLRAMLILLGFTGKIELVKEIIVRLSASFDAAENAGSDSLYFTRVSPWEFLGGPSAYVSISVFITDTLS